MTFCNDFSLYFPLSFMKCFHLWSKWWDTCNRSWCLVVHKSMVNVILHESCWKNWYIFYFQHCTTMNISPRSAFVNKFKHRLQTIIKYLKSSCKNLEWIVISKHHSGKIQPTLLLIKPIGCNMALTDISIHW